MPVRDTAFGRTLRRILLVQAIFTGVGALTAFLLTASDNVVALLYGGAATMATTLYSGWRLHVATRGNQQGPALNMMEFYKATLLRFILAIALLALGLGYLKLKPLAMIVGFAIAQTGFLFGRGYAARRRG